MAVSCSANGAQWSVDEFTAGQGGDLFAIIAERRSPEEVRLCNGECRADMTSDAVIIARGSFARRSFLGAFVSTGYEHQVAVVDADGGPATLIVAHSRDEAPLEGLDFETGELRWSRRGLRGAWALAAGRGNRMVGASFRGEAKLVCADTGKFRFSWKGDIQPLIGAGEYAVALQSGRGKSGDTISLFRIADGAVMFTKRGTPSTDAAISKHVLAVAGRGLFGLTIFGEDLWIFEPDLWFSSVVGIPEGFRAHSCERGIVDVGLDGTLIRDFPSIGDTLMGNERVISKGDIRSIEDGETWDFSEALLECAENAYQRHLQESGEVGASKVVATRSEPRTKRVVHPRFGRGTVLREWDDKACVQFDDGAERTMAKRFLASLEE
jgi:hypothetical protein